MNKGTRRKEAEAIKRIVSDTSNASGQAPAEEHAATTKTSKRRIYYDRVLVDADCTHDGSVRHMGKVAAMEDER